MGRLDGKTAIVVGAGLGIGRSIALRFAEEGADLIISARTKSTVDEVAAQAGKNIHAMAGDVGSESDVDALVAEAKSRWGKLDIVVNCAAITMGPLRRTHGVPVELWDDVMNVNIRGAFLLLRASLPLILEGGRGGSIINVSSIAAMRAIPGRCAYSASKAAMDQLTRTVAYEYGPDNIRVNSILPGATATPRMKTTPKELIEAGLAKIPSRRMAEPEEVAALALFLASDESAYVTGSAYVIDGGMTLS